MIVKEYTNTPIDENSEAKNRPQMYRQLIFDKRAKTTQWIKDSLFIKGYGSRYS